MKALAILLVLFASGAQAVTGDDNGNGNGFVSADSSADAFSESVSGADSSAISDSSAAGGSAIAEGGSQSVSVSQNRQRNAPGIAMGHPQATMDCMRGFGAGGSNQNGSLLIGPQWKDGDCMAAAQFETLAGLDLPIPAANAYCARKRFHAPFGGVEACEAAIAQSLIDRRIPEVKEVFVPDSQCREALGRCESVTK